MTEYNHKDDPCWECEKLGHECLECPNFITGYEPLGEREYEDKSEKV